ncbi:MAG TPA: hypothetical protein VFE33_31940 [Thermoanaerobaculia bacterium]|nr:hypothetical protein [Thermoanaerobaculia bacterium]
MLWLRALAIWLLLMTAEVIHGTLRTLFLAPRVGDFLARQIAVGTGSLIILGIVALTRRWLRAESARSQLGVGLLWVVLTLVLEIGLGRLVFGFPWERILSDYDLPRGGLMPLGLLVMALAPLLVARRR